MSWVDLLLLLAFVAGLVAGGMLIARSPTFWVGLGMVALQRLWPYMLLLIAYLKLPMKPQDQVKLDNARRRGWEWDNFNKKPRDK